MDRSPLVPDRIDLNADVGESFGPWPMGADAELIPLVSSVNIACGAHAGDPATMLRTAALARAHGAVVGAHPGYPDLAGLRAARPGHDGRRPACLAHRAGRRDPAAARVAGAIVRHVKPHGALYNRAAGDPEHGRHDRGGDPRSRSESRPRRPGGIGVDRGRPRGGSGGGRGGVRRSSLRGRRRASLAASCTGRSSDPTRRPSRRSGSPATGPSGRRAARRWRSGRTRSASTATAPARSRSPGRWSPPSGRAGIRVAAGAGDA